jgi:hypothetical protein
MFFRCNILELVDIDNNLVAFDRRKVTAIASLIDPETRRPNGGTMIFAANASLRVKDGYDVVKMKLGWGS